MKKYLVTLGFAFISICISAQTLSRITITNNTNADIISFEDQTLVINITEEGSVINWGTKYSGPNRNIYSQERLEKYMGREEYYAQSENEACRGKIKYIGRVSLTYYTDEEDKDLKGKIKSIGNQRVEYYNAYIDIAVKGKVKTIGNTSFTYYLSFDDVAYKGKLRSVGETALIYYSSFDDKVLKGKIKSINGSVFTYYSSYDRREYSGSLKSGARELYFNGIYYYLRN